MAAASTGKQASDLLFLTIYGTVLGDSSATARFYVYDTIRFPGSGTAAAIEALRLELAVRRHK